MREHKFRGQDYQGHWHYGSLVMFNDGSYAIAENDPTWTDDGYHTSDYDLIKVRPETVGQFTNVTDCHNNEIYEGDILQEDYPECKYEVIWEDSRLRWAYRELGCEQTFSLVLNSLQLRHYTVIGNIHNDPELLKKEA